MISLVSGLMVSKSLNMNSKFHNMQMTLPFPYNLMRNKSVYACMKLPNSFSLMSSLVLTIEETKVIKVGA